MNDPISEDFGNVPNAAEPFGNIPQAAETFRTFPNHAEGFGTLRNHTEKTEHHTLSVREVARMFEQASVPRTERSIINWCQQNRQGIARLDAYFDTNERKYFITSESVTRAIQEEQAKASANGQPSNPPEKQEHEIPKAAERETNRAERNEDAATLEYKLRDLEISNRAKDYFIEQLQRERDTFNDERQQYVEKLIGFSRKVGELETQLVQLDSPSSENRKWFPVSSEPFGKQDVENHADIPFVTEILPNE